LPQPRQQLRKENSTLLTAPTVQNLKKGYHTRTNSNISFEEWSYGTTKNSTHYHRHTRVHSWSDCNNIKSTNQVVQERKSLDSSNKALLVGIHNQYHPPNSETPPHGKPYVKVSKKKKRWAVLLLLNWIIYLTIHYR
jgi:hypothetical protein